ncbi:SDR family NAD(P)-dependent oxidoreductase [Sphingorhabdus sp. YGSMI21]|uniref:SDR family NAD(P)-dependent oxidoreductase n=1 Tax=Sphingorhabdus sp. YGSMI21 TaxID=2077182 RepID=UPI000C1DDC6B|nr:SDR family NAD(P)-dependent oxidoreductase [Sphingorhabdus sp. YGSMI21]ATW03387.1 SDR family oxidoreductase [Sphingorhabdus sp. YGSMI21]
MNKELSFGLSGHTALITGAGLGIGKASALDLARQGARVVLVDNDPRRLSEAEALFTGNKADLLSVTCDVTDEAAVTQLYAEAKEAGFMPDILVNNVGGGRSGRIWDMSVEDWDYTMRLSLRSMFLCTRAALPAMMDRQYGRIICLSSGARNGTVWNAFHTGACAYSTAKAGVIGFVRDMAIELADHGITINAVAPGPIDTELAGPYLQKMHEDGLEYSPIRMVPMHRLGTPEEVASAVTFLASREASYITGTTLDVAGGR